MIPNYRAVNCCSSKTKKKQDSWKGVLFSFLPHYMIIFQTLPPVSASNSRLQRQKKTARPVVASGACEAPRCKNPPRWSYYSHPCPTTLAIHELECRFRVFRFLKNPRNLNKSKRVEKNAAFSQTKKKCSLCIFQQTRPKSYSFSFWRTSTFHPEKIHVSHGQQDQLCQQKCSVPCSGPPLPNDLPENPRNRGFLGEVTRAGRGTDRGTVELWNRGTWVTLAFAPSWLNWEPPPGGVERVWPRKGVESWGSWCFNGNWERGGFSTQPTNLHRFKTQDPPW